MSLWQRECIEGAFSRSETGSQEGFWGTGTALAPVWASDSSQKCMPKRGAAQTRFSDMENAPPSKRLRGWSSSAAAGPTTDEIGYLIGHGLRMNSFGNILRLLVA